MAIKDLSKINRHLFLCNGGSCKLLGAEESTTAIRSAINECGLTDQVHTTKTLCNGRCKDGPIVISMPQGIWFRGMVPEKADLLIKKFLALNKVPWEDVLFVYGSDNIYTEEMARGQSETNEEGFSSYF